MNHTCLCLPRSCHPVTHIFEKLQSSVLYVPLSVVDPCVIHQVSAVLGTRWQTTTETSHICPAIMVRRCRRPEDAKRLRCDIFMWHFYASTRRRMDWKLSIMLLVRGWLHRTLSVSGLMADAPFRNSLPIDVQHYVSALSFNAARRMSSTFCLWTF